MVATSGTAMAIGALAASDDERPPRKLHGYRISRERLDQLVEKLVLLTPEERKALSPINDRRAEIIVPGALILQTTMQMLGVEEMVLSERALREGLIVDWMLRHGLLEDRFSFQSSIFLPFKSSGVARARQLMVLGMWRSEFGCACREFLDGADDLWRSIARRGT